jgi:hypothetical protein
MRLRPGVADLSPSGRIVIVSMIYCESRSYRTNWVGMIAACSVAIRTNWARVIAACCSYSDRSTNRRCACR